MNPKYGVTLPTSDFIVGIYDTKAEAIQARLFMARKNKLVTDDLSDTDALKHLMEFPTYGIVQIISLDTYVKDGIAEL